MGARRSNAPSTVDDLPDPTAALVLFRVSVECFLAVMSRKKGERFLRLMGETLATEEAVSAILPIRPNTDHERVQRARREAVALFRQQLRGYFQSLPPK